MVCGLILKKLSTEIYRVYIIDKMYDISVPLLRNLLSKEKDFASRNPDTFRIVDEKLRAVLYYCHSLKKLGKIERTYFSSSRTP